MKRSQGGREVELGMEGWGVRGGGGGGGGEHKGIASRGGLAGLGSLWAGGACGSWSHHLA